MSILVLGAGGQLGQTFRQIFTEREESAVFADRRAIDLRDDQKILDGLNAKVPSIVINCAAYTAVDRAEDEPELAHRINGAAVGTIAKWCEDNDAAMIHYSTDYVFNGTKTAPYNEADNPNPQSVYGRSKLAGELAFKDAGCRGICLRTSWVLNFGANSSHHATPLHRARGGQSGRRPVRCPQRPDLSQTEPAILEELGSAALHLVPVIAMAHLPPWKDGRQEKMK